MKNWVIVVLIFLICFFGLILFGRTFKRNESLVTLYIGPQTVECNGVSQQRCYQVKETPEAEYSLFYDDIVGFNYKPGFEYEILVEMQDNDPRLADASTFQYQYVSTVSQESKPYIQIVEPSTASNVDATKPFTIKGTGKALFENNVVIEMSDGRGETWGPTPTVMTTEELGGEGVWEMEVTPLNITGKLIIRAFSPSPKEGQDPYEDLVTVYSK